MIKLTLTLPDAHFLRASLATLAEHMDNELVHTDARAMQRSLALDVKQLADLREYLDRAIDAELEEGPSVSTAREMR